MNLKISVLKTGEVRVEGKHVGLKEVEQELDKLKTAGGSVWYYREAAQEEPHPNAMEVIRMVAERRLPIRLCSKPDFSDAVDDQGRSRPR
jgi:hypothetical protein